MKKAFILCFFLINLSINAQIISTIAGTGVGSYTGDGGPAINATFSEPQGVALDNTGNVYVVDEDDNVIRKINLSGIIHTIIGTGGIGYSGDGGPATLAKLNSPGGACIDRKGNIYIADSYNDAVRKVNTAGIIYTVAGQGTISGFGGDGGPATLAYLNFPEQVAVDIIGNLYIADAGNNRIRKVDTNGIITTIAGTGAAAFSGDGGPATAACLSYPTGIIVDTTTSNIYIGDANNNVVRKIDTNGIITTIAGTGVIGYSGDGALATLATLNKPQGLTIDTAGTVYVSDGGNNVIRKINTSGIISTYVGSGIGGYGGDGGPAFLAKIFDPPGITVDITGNLYIAEYYNSRVRKVSFCPAPLNFSVNGTFTICTGDSAILTASGATTYTWSANADSALTASIIVKPVISNTYSIVGVYNTCAALDTITVSVISCGAGMNEIESTNFKIYPNPTSSMVNIQSQFTFFDKLEVYNSLGEKMFTGLIRKQETSIDMSELTSGIYFIRILKNMTLLHQSTLIKY